MPLDKFPGWTAGTAEALFARTRGSGAEVIKLKGGAGFAVGLSIREVDPRRRARPEADPAGLVAGQRARTASATSASRSRRSSAARGSRRSSRSSSGPRKSRRFQHSGQVLRETIDQVLKKNPAAVKPAARPESPKTAPANGGGPVRVTMRRRG